MNRILRRLEQILEVIIVVIFVVLCLVVFLNVIGRSLSDSLIWSVELSRLLFVYLILLSATIALKNKDHFKIQLLTNLASKSIQKVIEVISNLFVLAVLVILLIGSWNLTVMNIQSKIPTINISSSFLYGIGLVTSLLMIAITLIEIYQLIFKKENSEETSEIHS